ncbi:MAG: hypothetical protein EZS28_038544 [Streblomastix strix]|uniref:Uncharacterized protein n=1 Tax=Streblomastix strix TaxID=222440 RepID=A0A5J4U6T0_9EUKA|nr:MAG: hypothetical protein EZS28_038544 [Streblomastix strix]
MKYKHIRDHVKKKHLNEIQIPDKDPLEVMDDEKIDYYLNFIHQEKDILNQQIEEERRREKDNEEVYKEKEGKGGKEKEKERDSNKVKYKEKEKELIIEKDRGKERVKEQETEKQKEKRKRKEEKERERVRKLELEEERQKNSNAAREEIDIWAELRRKDDEEKRLRLGDLFRDIFINLEDIHKEDDDQSGQDISMKPIPQDILERDLKLRQKREEELLEERRRELEFEKAQEKEIELEENKRKIEEQNKLQLSYPQLNSSSSSVLQQLNAPQTQSQQSNKIITLFQSNTDPLKKQQLIQIRSAESTTDNNNFELINKRLMTEKQQGESKIDQGIVGIENLGEIDDNSWREGNISRMELPPAYEKEFLDSENGFLLIDKDNQQSLHKSQIPIQSKDKQTLPCPECNEIIHFSEFMQHLASHAVRKNNPS